MGGATSRLSPHRSVVLTALGVPCVSDPFEYRSQMLILVDNRPIRRSYTARLRRARRAIARLETQIARYNEVDAPAFYLWYHREFGQILSHHRGLREQIAAHEFVQQDLDRETAETAFDDEKTPAEDSFPETESSAADQFQNSTETYDNFSFEPKEPYRECQRLFRRIALLLHPDRGGPLIGERKLWWLQAQEAYEHGDFVAFKLILSRCEPPPRTVAMSCADILQVIQEMRKRAEGLIGWRARLRREPAWRFTAKSDQARASLRTRLGRELASIERALIARLRQVAPAPDVWTQECEPV
jgi:hypothetical protein